VPPFRCLRAQKGGRQKKILKEKFHEAKIIFINYRSECRWDKNGEEGKKIYWHHLPVVAWYKSLHQTPFYHKLEISARKITIIKSLSLFHIIKHKRHNFFFMLQGKFSRRLQSEDIKEVNICVQMMMMIDMPM